MNLHTVATIFVIIGFLLTVFCLVEAEVCYRRVMRHLERNAATGGATGGQDGRILSDE